MLLTFDFDAESDETRTAPERIVPISRAQYGAAVGVSRVLRVLNEFGLKATFFVPGWVVEKYAEAVRGILAGGHEVAAHGYMHEKASELGETQERAMLERTVHSFRQTLGFQPSGYRAPWFDLSSRSLKLLSASGFAYDSSLMRQDMPYLIKGDDYSMVELPVEWVLDDYPLFEVHRKSPREVLDIWTSEFDSLFEENLLFNLTMHPEVIGRPARIAMLRELIRHVLSKNDVWITRAGDLAEWWLKNKANL